MSAEDAMKRPTPAWLTLARRCRARSEENRAKLQPFAGDVRSEILRLMGTDVTANLSGRCVPMSEAVADMTDGDAVSLLDDLRNMDVDAADPVLAAMESLMRQVVRAAWPFEPPTHGLPSWRDCAGLDELVRDIQTWSRAS